MLCCLPSSICIKWNTIQFRYYCDYSKGPHGLPNELLNLVIQKLSLTYIFSLIFYSPPLPTPTYSFNKTSASSQTLADTIPSETSPTAPGIASPHLLLLEGLAPVRLLQQHSQPLQLRLFFVFSSDFPWLPWNFLEGAISHLYLPSTGLVSHSARSLSWTRAL